LAKVTLGFERPQKEEQSEFNVTKVDQILKSINNHVFCPKSGHKIEKRTNEAFTEMSKVNINFHQDEFGDDSDAEKI
jgi:NADH pyrophosphatase NudC (nudix superfamily)